MKASLQQQPMYCSRDHNYSSRLIHFVCHLSSLQLRTKFVYTNKVTLTNVCFPLPKEANVTAGIHMKPSSIFVVLVPCFFGGIYCVLSITVNNWGHVFTVLAFLFLNKYVWKCFSLLTLFSSFFSLAFVGNWYLLHIYVLQEAFPGVKLNVSSDDINACWLFVSMKMHAWCSLKTN